MVVGLIGTVVPILPGILLIWLTLLFYVLLHGMEAVGLAAFSVMTLIAVVAGSADLWLPLLGAKSTGASKRAMLLGFIGGVAGLFMGGPLGSIAGYALGVLLGQYHKLKDWDLALKASLGGLAGMGVAKAIQLGGGLLILIIFVWRALAGG